MSGFRQELRTQQVDPGDLINNTLRYGDIGTIRRVGALLELEGIKESLLVKLEKAVSPSTASFPGYLLSQSVEPLTVAGGWCSTTMTELSGISIHKDNEWFRESLNLTAAQTKFPARLIEKDYYCTVLLEYLGAIVGDGSSSKEELVSRRYMPISTDSARIWIF
jgi:hypothetical protein